MHGFTPPLRATGSHLHMNAVGSQTPAQRRLRRSSQRFPEPKKTRKIETPEFLLRSDHLGDRLRLAEFVPYLSELCPSRRFILTTAPLWIFCQTTSSAKMDMSKAIKALKLALPEVEFAMEGTQEHQTLNRGFFQSALQSDIVPACIVRPRSKSDISTFVKTIRPFVVADEAAFAIVGGGRQPAPGCSNIQDGITLNLGLLRGIQIDIENGVVSIAAGETWGPVFDKLVEIGLGCSGSRSSKGGIGGLALSGGLSIFSSREGFICDDVLNYEIVLGSGEIVNANSNENADLWKALRGGGNNFGVVTRYDMRTFKQGPFWGGALYYFSPSFPGQVEALVHELQKPDATADTHLMMSLGYTAMFGPEAVGMNQMYYTQEVEKPPVLDVFTSVEPQIGGLNTMRMMNLAEASREQAGDIPPNQRSAYMNLHVKADVATLVAGGEIWKAALEPVKDCEGLICSYTLQPYARSQLQASAKKGGNSLGLDPSSPIVSVAFLMYWNSKSDDEKILGTFKSALEKMRAEASSKGQLIDFVYMNYSFNFQDPIASYGAENKKHLQGVSRKFDPEGIFQKGVPGGWKLFA
ncbi:uncharacterized protein JN550_000216 [Neoarthrinium moseri]|uniref:uncharacterized protein n=1 Tax=Neoarthrinium moseri TaxID=1658444 RepID=UPI001FDC5349|nr:uncharacterized protein JN550_000216 [Neoarthrinium moseri]KAI1878034.1 hypothetical protein JN550_000216 [Neoarthrinium moseri]